MRDFRRLIRDPTGKARFVWGYFRYIPGHGKVLLYWRR